VRSASRVTLGVLALIYLAAAFADWLAPFKPTQQNREWPWEPPSWAVWGERSAAQVHGKPFLLGTDGLGRDQFSRLLHGARISLYTGVLAASISALVGLVLGGIAGYFGGWVDRLVMQAADTFLALPWMYLLLAARAFFPLRSDPNLVFAVLLVLLGLIGWARPARLARGIVASTKERDSVAAARGFGAGPFYLLFRHALPPALPSVLTYLTLAIPQYTAAEATLSFLGLGLSGSTPSWGGMIASLAGLEVLGSYWWMWSPAVALALVMVCYSVVSKEVSSYPKKVGGT
jgi:peptide/nickel transport system permease protein